MACSGARGEATGASSSRGVSVPIRPVHDVRLLGKSPSGARLADRSTEDGCMSDLVGRLRFMPLRPRRISNPHASSTDLSYLDAQNHVLRGSNQIPIAQSVCFQ